MPGEAADSAEGTPVLRTLADKVNWLIDRAHPAGRGPYTNNEVADLIKKTTGEEISYTQIWKLRNGQAQNPQMRLIEAMARTFGVPRVSVGGVVRNLDGWRRLGYADSRELPRNGAAEPAQLLAVPYFAWANRDGGGMRVWIPVTD